jgi:hypothetical protein
MKEGKTFSIETPRGVVHGTNFQETPRPQQITLVTGSELQSLIAGALPAEAFLATYLEGAVEPTLEQYDRAFRAWQKSASPQHTAEQVIEILGAHLGNKCVADLNMEWVKVTDEYGTDYAVRSKSYEVMAFPFSSVLKRIEDREYDFMNGVYYAVKHDIESGDAMPRETSSN